MFNTTIRRYRTATVLLAASIIVSIFVPARGADYAKKATWQETVELFGYAEIEDEARWNSIADTDVCKKWWKYMSDIMVTNDDNSPVLTVLQEVFYLE